MTRSVVLSYTNCLLLLRVAPELCDDIITDANKVWEIVLFFKSHCLPTNDACPCQATQYVRYLHKCVLQCRYVKNINVSVFQKLYGWGKCLFFTVTQIVMANQIYVILLPHTSYHYMRCNDIYILL